MIDYRENSPLKGFTLFELELIMTYWTSKYVTQYMIKKKGGGEEKNSRVKPQGRVFFYGVHRQDDAAMMWMIIIVGEGFSFLRRQILRQGMTHQIVALFSFLP